MHATVPPSWFKVQAQPLAYQPQVQMLQCFKTQAHLAFGVLGQDDVAVIGSNRVVLMLQIHL